MKYRLKNNIEKYDNTFYIIKELLRLLPIIARDVMEKIPENSNFSKNPDDPKEHAERWHQFGIISHTQAFIRAYKDEAHHYFKKWNLELKINAKLYEKIDGITKRELLGISGILHDIGKFARTFKMYDSKLESTYFQHEAKSEILIKKNKMIYSLLNETHKLTENHIDFIARCAGLHFELGKTRNAIKESSLGFTIAFANSRECEKVFKEIATEHPLFKIEIGLLFLYDSLAKTDVRIEVKTDEEIEQKSTEIDLIIAKRNLNPKLKAAIQQLPVNIELVKKYLESVC
jgi:hypothetical protein